MDSVWKVSGAAGFVAVIEGGMSSAALRLPTFDELYDEIEALPVGMTGEILGPGELRTMSLPR